MRLPSARVTTRKPKVKETAEPAAEPLRRPFFPILTMLFVASGCSALIYEIVWYQLLQLVIGSSAVSLAVLLATFMGGLCAGSLLLPHVLTPRAHPLRVYAALELGIATCGILALIGMPLIDRVYVAAVGHGVPAMFFRAIVAAVCLLPPTLLMGASLPAAARWIESTRDGVSWMGRLYAGNTVGAVFGCLLAGFYLLRVYDMTTATYIAAAVNCLVALISHQLSKRAAYQATQSTHTGKISSLPRRWPIYVAIGLSGACALGAEVIWTRLLSLLLGATVYTFSIILAVFLVGLGIGSGVGALAAPHLRDPKLAFGCCQILLAAAIAWTAYAIGNSLPYWPINPLLSKSVWLTFQIDLIRCVWAILPPTLLWGASFPFALATLTSRTEDPGQIVGTVYAANTAGAILGALAFSLILIPWIGTRESERTLIALSAAAALVMLVPLYWPFPNKRAAVMLAASMASVLILINTAPGVPADLIAYGRRILTSASRSRILYVGEGMNSSIAISQWDDGAVQFHVSGKVEASTEPYDMRLQRMLGHLPGLLRSGARSVLVVGFGAGVTAGSLTLYPDVARIVICEMEPLVPPAAHRFFARENYGVWRDPRVEMVYDDARHYILTSGEKFDIITSDPIHPWVKGSATLYSKEYFDLVKQHLNPGGVVTQWVPLYESDVATVKSEVATFFDAFPNGTVWGNENAGGGYDMVLLGQIAASRIDVDALEQRLATAEYSKVARSLHEVAFRSAINLLGTYAGQAADLRSWVSGAEIYRDSNLRLQYLAGLALNFNQEEFIYNQLLAYRQFPVGLFVASPDREKALRIALGFP